MKTTQYHTSGIARSGACFVAALCLGVGSALAAPSVTLPLGGVVIANGLNQFRNSGDARLDAATNYTFAFSGKCHGEGTNSLMLSLAPSSIGFRDFLNNLKQGSGGFLRGTHANPTGTFPFTVINKPYSYSTTTLLGPASFSAKFEAGVRGGPLTGTTLRGQVYYNITNVSIMPPPGYNSGRLVFEPGAKLVITVAP